MTIKTKNHIVCDREWQYIKCKKCELKFLNISGQTILQASPVPLIAPFLFLRARNRRRILRLFSPVVLTPSESAIAMRYISDHSTDIGRTHGLIEYIEQKYSFRPPARKFSVTAWCLGNDKSKETRPQENIKTPDLIDVLFVSTAWQITTYCAGRNTTVKGGQAN